MQAASVATAAGKGGTRTRSAESRLWATAAHLRAVAHRSLRRTFVEREQAERAAREPRRERTVRSMLKLTAALALAGFAAACAAVFGVRG